MGEKFFHQTSTNFLPQMLFPASQMRTNSMMCPHKKRTIWNITKTLCLAPKRRTTKDKLGYTEREK